MGVINTHLSSDLHKKLKDHCYTTSTSIQRYIVAVVERALEKGFVVNLDGTVSVKPVTPSPKSNGS